MLAFFINRIMKTFIIPHLRNKYFTLGKLLLE